MSLKLEVDKFLQKLYFLNMGVESSEHKPELDLEASRVKLQSIVERQVEVSEETLFNSIQDVLASRAGGRWREIDECVLYTKSGIQVFVGYNGPIEGEPWEVAWMQAGLPGEVQKNYEVRKRSEDGVYGYELGEVDVETEPEEFNPVSNYGDLAPARLLSILADAHLNTPLEKLTEDDFVAA